MLYSTSISFILSKYMENIAKKIMDLRQEAGFTLTQLAEKAGLSLAFISKLESGDYHDLSISSSKSLAKGLGLNLRDFLSRMGFFDENNNRSSLQLINQALRSDGYSNKQAEKVILYARFLRDQEENNRQ